MRRGMGKWLGGLETKWLFVIAAACLVLSGLLVAVLAPHGARTIGLVAGVGIVALLLGVYRLIRELVLSRDEQERGGFIALLAATVLAALGITAFCVTSLSFYWKETRSACWNALMGETIEVREQSLEVGLERARSPFSILPELVGFRASEDCLSGAADLELVKKGECPFYLMQGVACRCGAERWPEDAQCSYPKCIRYEAEPRLSCEH